MNNTDIDIRHHHDRRKAWPKHLSPWSYNETIPTVSEPPPSISHYTPFETVLHVIRGVVPAKRNARSELDQLRLRLNGRKVVLAGGCIRDLYLFGDANKIKDLDVFILDCDTSDSNTILDAIARVVYALDGDYTASADYFLNRIRATNRYILNVGNINLDDTIPHPIQVITSTAKSVEELLEHFDWNICRFAYDGKTFWFPGWKDVALQRLTLGNNIPDPYWTMRRGVLFSEKFKKLPVRLHKQDIMMLFHMWMMCTDGKEVVNNVI